MSKPPDLILRPLTTDDRALLRTMLYHAIHVAPGATPPAESIVDSPDLSRYHSGWGKPTDIGLAAEIDGKQIGAAWLRLLTGAQRGYGYVDDDTPELGIAVLPNHRGRGVGARLLESLISQAAQYGYAAISLSVSDGNPAVRLYQRFGFAPVSRAGDSITMRKMLRRQPP